MRCAALPVLAARRSFKLSGTVKRLLRWPRFSGTMRRCLCCCRLAPKSTLWTDSGFRVFFCRPPAAAGPPAQFSRHSYTPLWHAVTQGHAKVIKVLASAANVNIHGPKCDAAPKILSAEALKLGWRASQRRDATAASCARESRRVCACARRNGR